MTDLELKKRSSNETLVRLPQRKVDLVFWSAVTIAVVAACLITAWTEWSGPSTYFPVGIDIMGHLTKPYLFAERWRSLNFNDWCYEWYNGATLSQYYPPLANWVCGILQLCFD